MSNFGFVINVKMTFILKMSLNESLRRVILSKFSDVFHYGQGSGGALQKCHQFFEQLRFVIKDIQKCA